MRNARPRVVGWLGACLRGGVFAAFHCRSTSSWPTYPCATCPPSIFPAEAPGARSRTCAPCWDPATSPREARSRACSSASGGSSAGCLAGIGRFHRRPDSSYVARLTPALSRASLVPPGTSGRIVRHRLSVAQRSVGRDSQRHRARLLVRRRSRRPPSAIGSTGPSTSSRCRESLRSTWPSSSRSDASSSIRRSSGACGVPGAGDTGATTRRWTGRTRRTDGVAPADVAVKGYASMALLIYGANGYTGELVARRAAQVGVPALLAEETATSCGAWRRSSGVSTGRSSSTTRRRSTARSPA